MSVQRFRSIEEMPKPWREPDDPNNLRLVAEMMAFYHRLRQEAVPRAPFVRRFRTLEELNADRGDPYLESRRPRVEQ